MIGRTTLLLAAMGLMLVAASGTALAQDVVTCGAGTCWGTSAGDIMIGTLDSNGRHGLGGDDLIRGLGGNDSLSGDDGNDAVHGGSGNDRVEGNAGDDLVTGDPGADEVLGGWGDDRVVGGSGTDMLKGGSGGDRIEAQDGFADVISCGAGSRDVVFFDPGLDTVAADCESKVTS
jgi:Ca2+-binding RTX toxin-like protein